MSHALIIGNSHTVALKQAWATTGERHDRHRIDFFVVPQPQLKYLRFAGSKLGAPTRQAADDLSKLLERLNSRSSIDLAGYDRIVLVGMGNPFWIFSELLLAFDIDGLREVGAPQRMSRAAYDRICVHLAEQALRPSLVRGLSAHRVTLLERQRPAESCAYSDNPAYAHWRSMAPNFDGVDAALSVYSTIFAEILAGKDIALLPQPRETIRPNGLTVARFTQGSISLATGRQHGKSDHSHMNADYGRLCLAEIFDHLDKERLPALVNQI